MLKLRIHCHFINFIISNQSRFQDLNRVFSMMHVRHITILVSFSDDFKVFEIVMQSSDNKEIIPSSQSKIL